MKRTHLTLLAMAILASGCDKSPEELIIGTWDCQVEYPTQKGVSLKETQHATINDDGTFNGVTQASLNIPEETITTIKSMVLGLSLKIPTQKPLQAEKYQST